MTILSRYVLSMALRNIILSLCVFVFLFVLIDFFDRIDNIAKEGAHFFTALLYFIYKIPMALTWMLPVSMLAGSMITVGVLSKNSEITAMRAAGIRLTRIYRPILGIAIVMSISAIFMNETLVPYAAKRVREIYNIDIKAKDKSGGYSQADLWWRTKDQFFSVDMFDSSANTLKNLSEFELDTNFRIKRRLVAEQAGWIDPLLGWHMKSIKEYNFDAVRGGDSIEKLRIESYRELPLPIKQKPTDFYDYSSDPETMSYRQLKRFIQEQTNSGLDIRGYLADLYSKFSFPFSTFVITFTVLPFALRSARSTSLAIPVLAAVFLAFSYYAVHSFSLAFGRAELWHPLIAAWAANFLMMAVGVVLNLGAEAP